MADKKDQKARAYTEEYKKNAVKLVREVGNKKAAAELNMSLSTINGWIRKYKDGELDLGAGTRTPGETMTLVAELKMLREENKRLAKEITRKQETIDFLTDATAFFAASRQK